MAAKKVDLRRVSVDKADIFLAVDIFSNAGTLVAPAGTHIDKAMKESILQHGRAVVTVTGVDEQPVAVEESVMSISEEKQVEFAEFKQDYVQMGQQISGTLDSVCKGEAIDVDKAFDIVDTMLGKMRSKNDVFLYLNFMKDYDSITAIHSNHVAMLANIFGHWLKLPHDELAVLTVAGALHDVGKVEIPKEIVNKPGKLTPEERRVIKAHPTKGYLLLKKYDLPKGVVMGAYSHHERMDGSGYPLGLTSEKIEFVPKAVAIVDMFDSMTSHRAYRERMCPFEVIRRFEVGMYGELDAELLLIFLRNIAENYVGAWGTLSNGIEAKVMFIHPTNISKPLVQTAAGEFINLADRPELRIVSLV